MIKLLEENYFMKLNNLIKDLYLHNNKSVFGGEFSSINYVPNILSNA